MLRRPTTSVMLSTSAAALVAVLVACGPGCAAGAAARENVLLPSIQRVWPGVREDAAHGGALPAMLAEVDAAVAAGNVAILRATVDAVAASAEAGVARRESEGGIGPNGAKLLRERTAQFANMVAKMGAPR